MGRWLPIVLAVAATPAGAKPPPRIADLWYAHNASVIMLGAADRIAVTVDSPAQQPWMYRIAPVLRRARLVNAEPANAEALLAAGVGLAFVARPAEAERLTRLGVPARALGFTDLSSMRASLQGTADALATPLAQARLRAYDGYLDGVLARLRRGLQGVPPSARPRVLHIASLSPLRVDGSASLIDEWITLAGGRNVAAELHGTLQPVSVEQIARWNPDLIIVGGQDARPEDNPLAIVPALKGRRLVRNPSGVYQWDRHGPEVALQLLWAARLMHPAQFAGVDMTRETQVFFRRFFGYALSADETARILAAAPPPAAPAG